MTTFSLDTKPVGMHVSRLLLASLVGSLLLAPGCPFAEAQPLRQAPNLGQDQVAQKDEAQSSPVEPVLGGLVTYADRTSFDIDFPGLPLEDFELGAVSAGGLVACPAPVDAAGDGVCFAPGAVEPGLAFEDEPGPAGADGLLLIGDGTFGNSSKILATNDFADSLEIRFADAVAAVGLDLINLPGPDDSLSIEVFGPGDVSLGVVASPSSAAGTFWGVSSPTPIERLVLTSTINQAEAVDDVAFGVVPFLVQDGVEAVDTCAPEPANENGIWEPNEEIELSVTLRASGGGFTGIEGTLSSSDAAIVFLDAQASWPDLAAGASADNLEPLRFVIDGDLCALEVDLVLDVSSDQGAFQIPISNTVGADQMPETDVAIPDGALKGAASELEITTDVTLSGLEVDVEIAHTWVGDLTISLRSPAGTEVVLLDRPGVPSDAFGCDNNDVRVTFSDGAAVDPEDSCNAVSSDPWITGAVLPAEALAAFDGESSQGLWTLRVRDAVDGDLGVIETWSLEHGEPLGAECVACSAQADLELSKSCTDFPDFFCTLTVSNLGPSSSFGVEVVDTIPAPLEWQADDCAAGPPAGDTLLWQVGTLDAGESAMCTLDFDAPPDESGDVTNVAVVSSGVPDPEIANDVASDELTLGTVLDIPTLGAGGLAGLVLLLTMLGLARLRRRGSNEEPH